MTIAAETVAFLTALYRRSSGYLTLSAIHPDRTQPTPSRHILLADTQALEKGLLDLLDEIHRLAAADERVAGIGLETANPALVPLYEQFGYEVENRLPMSRAVEAVLMFCAAQ